MKHRWGYTGRGTEMVSWEIRSKTSGKGESRGCSVDPVTEDGSQDIYKSGVRWKGTCITRTTLHGSV